MSLASQHAAIVGADSLQGRELGQVLRQRRLPFPLRLYAAQAASTTAAAEEEKRLLEFGEEAHWMETATPAGLAEAGLVFFADDAAAARELYPHLPAGCIVVDFTGGLEEIPTAALASSEQMASRSLASGMGGGPWLVANAAALTLAQILERLQQSVKVERAAAVILQPVSQHGQAGIGELHEQVRSLLAFQSVPTQVLGAQLAFNLRPEAPAVSEAMRLGRQIESLLAETESPAPPPALQVLQAPLFHAYLITLWFETPTACDAAGLSRWMQCGPAEPDVLSITDAEQPRLGPVRADARRGFWLQAAADNLRLPALEAVKLAELALRERPQ